MSVTPAAVTTPVTPAAPAAAVVDDTTDNFAAAFEQLAKLGDKPVTDEAMHGKPPVAAPAAPEKKVEEVPVPDAADAPADGDLPDPDSPDAKIAADEAARAAEKEKTAPAPAAPQLEQVLDRLAERLAPKPAPAKEEVQPPPPDFTAEESQQLQTYAKEFPDVMKSEALLRRADIGHAVKYVFREIEKHFGPAMAIVGQLATNAHLSDLEAEVEDYADVREKVVAWVDSQPPVLKNAYTQVIQAGTVADVAALITQYRAATGEGLQAPGKQATTSGQKETELPDPAKKAAEKLAPVSSKRSQVTVADPSKDNYDDAFKTFANEETT